MTASSQQFFEAIRSFAQEIGSQAPDLVFGPQHGQGLFHYTNLEALHHIVLSNDLWLTHSRYSNDEDENAYGERLSRDVVQNWTLDHIVRAEDLWRTKPPPPPGPGAPMPAYPDGGEWTRDLVRWYQRLVLEALDRPEENAAYVCCFCEQDNLLGHWRAYGANGTGVSIGLGADGFIPYTEAAEARGLVLRLWKVFYRVREQTSIVNSALEFAFYNANLPSLEQKANLAARVIHFFIPTFKNPDFEEEREYRLILSAPDGNAPPLRYRTGRGLLVPYVSLASTFPAGAMVGLPIESVRVGPGPQKLANLRSIELLLTQAGLAAAKVHASDTPYRG